jgi:ketopantoate reductase
MKEPVVIIGIGEIGSVFARGFLRTGHPVYPITRAMDMSQEAANIPEPELVLVAVGENELHNILANIPEHWRSRVALIQNELLPQDWEQHGYTNPTVISVWFEKKKGQDVKVVVPSPVFGPHAGLLSNALDEMDIPNVLVATKDEFLFELVRKNYYILTSNIAGLKTGGSVSDLWKNHQDFARSVVRDVSTVQSYLTGVELDSDKLIDAMLVAFQGDPDHMCMGRSAPARLQRALAIADEADLDVPVFKALSDELG